MASRSRGQNIQDKPGPSWQRHGTAWQRDPRNHRLDRMWEMKRAAPADDTEALMMAAPGEDLEHLVQDHPLKNVIAELLSEFNETDRDMLVMKLVEGLSLRDIAEVMELSKSDVHRRLRPLQARLVELVKSNPQIKEYMGGTQQASSEDRGGQPPSDVRSPRYDVRGGTVLGRSSNPDAGFDDRGGRR